MGFFDGNSRHILLIVVVIIAIIIAAIIIDKFHFEDIDRKETRKRRLLIGITIVVIAVAVFFGLYTLWQRKLPNGDGQRGEYSNIFDIGKTNKPMSRLTERQKAAEGIQAKEIGLGSKKPATAASLGKYYSSKPL